MPAHLLALRDEALAVTCLAWAERQGWKLGPGVDRAGPCPVCGGTDRFAIHAVKNSWNCRKCGVGDRGVISLVMFAEAVDFTRACEIVTGRSAGDEVDPARLQAARRAAAEAERRAAERTERYRENARADGYATWRRGSPWVSHLAVAGYLAQRGIPVGDGAHWEALGAFPALVDLPLRELVDHPYRRLVDQHWVTFARGPVMLAAVQLPDGRFGAVHQTWLDPSQPKGKAAIAGADGKALSPKLVRGIKKGGAIRLFTPPAAAGQSAVVSRQSQEGPTTADCRLPTARLVMGEGIETTLTALAWAFEPDTAYWAGVDLGNMAGRAARGLNGRAIEDEPDMDDVESFVPPPWVRELVFLADSDEEETHTIEKLTRGLKRAMRLRAAAGGPDLVAKIVPPPGPGQDLNDLVMRVDA